MIAKLTLKQIKKSVKVKESIKKLVLNRHLNIFWAVKNEPNLKKSVKNLVPVVLNGQYFYNKYLLTFINKLFKTQYIYIIFSLIVYVRIYILIK